MPSDLATAVSIDLAVEMMAERVAPEFLQGLPELHGRGRGDQLVRIVVWTPERLTPEQEETIRTLRDMEDPAPENLPGDSGRSIWSRVKEVFTQT